MPAFDWKIDELNYTNRAEGLHTGETCDRANRITVA